MLDNEQYMAKQCTADINPLKEAAINNPINEIDTRPAPRHFNPSHGLSSGERKFNEMYGG